MAKQQPAPFKTGDTVRLASGGPVMTAVGAKGGVVLCQWFTEDGRLQTAEFPSGSLLPAEGPFPSPPPPRM